MQVIYHIILALILFFIQNWVGSRAYSKGYIKFSLLDDKDEALSLNFVIKVFGPVVYLIITVSLLQYFGLNEITSNIINVVYYYLSIRILLIILYERFFIVNWFRIVSHYSAIVVIAYIINDKFINSVGELLPDFSQIKNEIWLLVIIFLYQLGNGIQERPPENQLDEKSRAYLPEIKNRKRKYINRQYERLQSKFKDKINSISNEDPSFNLIVYSLLIYENFNRPRIIRWVERLISRLSRRSLTQGIMQVKSNKPLTDIESVEIGTKDLYDIYFEYKSQGADYCMSQAVLRKHCPDKKYIRQVLFIAKTLVDRNDDKSEVQDLWDDIRTEFELY